MYSCGPVRLDNQLKPIYNSSMLIQDVAWRTCQERWTIETGSEKGSGKSVLLVRHDDDFKYIKWLNHFIRTIDGTLTGTNTLGQSGPGSNDNEGVLHIFQSFETAASSSYSSVPYPQHSLRILLISKDAVSIFYSPSRFDASSCGGFGEIWKIQWVELSPASGEDGWLSLARGGLGQVSHEMVGGRCKSQNRKNVYLSPYVEEPLNSKVIKGFVPELRSKCFSGFEIPMFYIYIYIYEHYMSISHIRIWLWYIGLLFQK